MKATSKLISVVLILALCLSLFTISAAAEVVVTAPLENSKLVAGNSYKGSAAGQASVEDNQNTVQGEALDESVETNDVVINDGFTAVASAEELRSALNAHTASIQLTDQIEWVGSLELDYDVTIDLGGKGKGIVFSGSGDAAVLSSANASLVNGNLFVSGDVAATEDAAAVPGFGTVAAGVGEGSVYLNGVYVSFTNDGGNAIFGQGISLGSGVFSQDVTAYYGEESAAAYDFATLDNGMFDVTAKAVAPAETDEPAADDAETVDGTVDGELVTVSGEYGEGADKIVVTVSGANMPEDVRVDVKPMDNSALQVGEDEEVLFVVDITLFVKDDNGEEVEYEPAEDPNVKEVSVTIRHPALGNVEEGEAVTLYHIVNEQAVPVTPAEEIAGQESMEFTTDSFSPYGAAKSQTTGSDGDVHYRVVTLDSKEITWSGNNLVVYYTGNKAPEAVSLMPYSLATLGDYDTYKAYLLDYDKSNTSKSDYTLNETAGTITIKKEAMVTISDGKYGVVFWYMDGNTRVYMVQPIIIVTKQGVEGVGDNFTPTTFGNNSKGTFDVEMCDYDSVKVKLSDELKSFTIKGGDCGDVNYTVDNKNKITIGGKTYNASEYFSVAEYTATDPAGHEFIAGKYLTLSQSLIKKLGFKEGVKLTVTQADGKSGEFTLNITPGIRVADGLDDYIKGKNLWVKFESCAPIDYDSDGTLAIWIGGQKISHDYYSISNDHCTLWIYRNLLDQLKSNNRYTLTARLWAFGENKEKVTWYPATASFNVLAAGSTSSKSPKTGDESNVALWASVLVLSGGAVIALIPKKRKSK